MYNRFRKSFLLKFVMIGMGLLGVGLILYYGKGMDTWGPLLGITGLVVILVNIIFYVGYMAIRQQF